MGPENFRVSVVIPTFNRSALLCEAVRSALDQTAAVHEVIVVDNGSTDDTRGAIARLGDPRVRYFYQDNSGGPVSPRNHGVREAGGDYIAYLDSDDRWHREKLDLQLAVLRERPDVGLVYCDCFFVDPSGRRVGRLSETKKLCEGDIFEALLGQNFIANSSVLVRRQTVLDHGLLDPRFVIDHDLDLWLKIARQSKIGFVPKPVVDLRIHPSGLSRDILIGRREFIDIISEWHHGRSQPISRRTYRRKVGRQLILAGMDNLIIDKRREALRYFADAVRRRPLHPLPYAALVIGVLLSAVPRVPRQHIISRALGQKTKEPGLLS